MVILVKNRSDKKAFISNLIMYNDRPFNEGSLMADEIDIANELMHNELARALKNREMRQQASDNAKPQEFCIDCEEVIPIERQELGLKRCKPCAEEVERRGQMFADNYPG